MRSVGRMIWKLVLACVSDEAERILAYVVDDEGFDIYGQVHELLDPNGRHGLAFLQARANGQLLFRRALVAHWAVRQRYRLWVHGGVKSFSGGVFKSRVIFGV